MDYFRNIRERIFPVGRLDYHSEGLLLMTNDGELDNILTHPKHEVKKVYEVTVHGKYSLKLADKMSKGVRIDSGVTAPCEIEVLGYDKEKNKTKVRMTLHEGKNREIRKMMAAFYYPVFGLKRHTVQHPAPHHHREHHYHHLLRLYRHAPRHCRQPVYERHHRS